MDCHSLSETQVISECPSISGMVDRRIVPPAHGRKG